MAWWGVIIIVLVIYSISTSVTVWHLRKLNRFLDGRFMARCTDVNILFEILEQHDLEHEAMRRLNQEWNK